MSSQFSLHQLGWRPFYSQQISLDEWESCFPARIACIERSQLTTLSERGEIDLPALQRRAAVGDWVLLESGSRRIARVFDRQTVLSRIAPGTHPDEQLIAANLDTAFLVSSCNHDFNLSRLERYIAIAREGHIEPVVVLTKADLAKSVDELVAEVSDIAAGIAIVALDARDEAQAQALLPWLSQGRTGAFVGSSGVGKSTLINALTGAQLATDSIREADSKGRHTTTSRRMVAVPNGGWLIDTPGMRELNVGNAGEGIRAAFADIEQLALRCRFRDCKHQQDAGCAVLAAVVSGELTKRRWDNYLKLRRETERATRTEQERREADRRFGKLYDAVKERQRMDRKG
jgi:ribosome biogenesis GTPase / thiamine phosphate phosphatase